MPQPQLAATQTKTLLTPLCRTAGFAASTAAEVSQPIAFTSMCKFVASQAKHVPKLSASETAAYCLTTRLLMEHHHGRPLIRLLMEHRHGDRRQIRLQAHHQCAYSHDLTAPCRTRLALPEIAQELERVLCQRSAPLPRRKRVPWCLDAE